jgi:hypothetical protein
VSTLYEAVGPGLARSKSARQSFSPFGIEAVPPSPHVLLSIFHIEGNENWTACVHCGNFIHFRVSEQPEAG